jgi:hypothetical protein
MNGSGGRLADVSRVGEREGEVCCPSSAHDLIGSDQGPYARACACVSGCVSCV